MAVETITEYNCKVLFRDEKYFPMPYVFHSLPELSCFTSWELRGFYPCELEITKSDKIFNTDKRKLKHYPHWARKDYRDFWYYNYDPKEIKTYDEKIKFILMDKLLTLGDVHEYVKQNYGKDVTVFPYTDSCKKDDLSKPIKFRYHEDRRTLAPRGVVLRIFRFAYWDFLNENDIVIQARTLEQLYGQQRIDFDKFFGKIKQLEK